MSLTIQKTDPRSAGASALLQASHAFMEAAFAPEHNHYLSFDALCAPEITFFSATENGATLGVGALATKTAYGEIKSMFTSDAARGQGIAGKILDAIINEARSQNLDTLRLETGNTLYAAHRLYEREGFAYRGPFADYPDSAVSIFMEKTLSESAPIGISVESPLTKDAATLIKASKTAFSEHYSIPDSARFEPDMLDKSGITFLVARRGNAAMGCVALINCGDYGEIKRLITLPEARGTGIAKALLHHVESTAKQQELSVVRLETRVKFTSALALYARFGYTPTGPYGDHYSIPGSLYFEKHFQAQIK